MRYYLKLFSLFLFFLFITGQTSIAPDAKTATSGSVTCGTTPTLVFNEDPLRRAWLVVAPAGNTATVYVGFDGTLTTANGLPLNANNTFSDTTYFGKVNCIVASGTQPLVYSFTKRR